jgi:nucleotide-binding universal stress UspA family protein
MQKLFNKILVPVDFTNRTIKAVEKASEIAMEYNCSIHLLHMVVASPVAGMSFAENGFAMPQLIDNKAELEFQLEKLCEMVTAKSKDTINVQYSMQAGTTWEEGISQFAILNQIDLILIGQKVAVSGKRSMRLNPDIIADKTNVPVITVPANRSITRLCSIIIPVTDFLPVRKLMYGVYMASSYNATIRLLGIENAGTKHKVMYYMMKAYKLISDNCDVKVEFEKTQGPNVAAAVNRYAQDKSADLIIVNPGTQTKMPGVLSSLLGNIIQRYSSPPVLTINPGSIS